MAVLAPFSILLIHRMVSTFCAHILATYILINILENYMFRVMESIEWFPHFALTFLRSHFGNYILINILANYMFFQLKVRLKKVLQPNHPYNYLNPSNGFHILRSHFLRSHFGNYMFRVMEFIEWFPHFGAIPYTTCPSIGFHILATICFGLWNPSIGFHILATICFGLWNPSNGFHILATICFGLWNPSNGFHILATICFGLWNPSNGFHILATICFGLWNPLNGFHRMVFTFCAHILATIP